MLAETATTAAFHFPTIQETLTVQNLMALLTLTAMEVVLGIDNIVFIAILAGKLPEHQREKARVIGLALALITRFINRNPTLKMLALSFLMLIGIVLVADGAGQHIPKGYIYFGMAFSLGVEMLNLATGKRKHKVA